jgi:hypothetical protein
MTGVNYVTDEKGNATAVLVPIKKWDEVQQELEKLKIFEDLKIAFKEMDLHRKGKLKTPTTAQLLNQL